MNPIPLVTGADFREKVLSSERPVVVWFTVPGCPPCRKIEPILVSLYYGYKKSMDFYRLDITEYAEVAQDIKVTSTPTLVYFNGGEEVFRQDSMPSKGEILLAIEKMLKTIEGN
jgi:thioredoxin-like negative regulator of GroEL